MSFWFFIFLRASRSLADFRSRWPLSMARAYVWSSPNVVKHSPGHSEPGSHGTPPLSILTHSKHSECLEYEATVPLQSICEHSRLPVPPAIWDGYVTNTLVQAAPAYVGAARYVAS